MVNLEPGRDYYADLELTPGATINDVRKQFRKLALKYHPDRNPGQEVEFNAKFQAISAANEVLTDPTLRAKYDAQRLRESQPKPFGEPVIRPNVPPRTKTTNFPPPPRPPPPSTHKTNFSPPPPASGGRRYERAPRPSSTAWIPAESEELKAKNNDYKAWESMRHGQGPIPKPRPPPRTAKTGGFEPKQSSPPTREPDGVFQRAGKKFEDLFDAGRTRMGRSSRSPSGRPSHGPDTFDEDDIPGKPSAYNVFKGEYPKKTGNMPPPPQVPPRTSRRQELPNVVKDPYFQKSARTRVPHTAAGGERIVTPNAGLHRATTATTARDNRHRPVWPTVDTPHFEGDHIRAASASAAHRQQAFQQQRAPSSTTSEATSSASSDEGESETIFGKGPANQSSPRTRRPAMPAGAGLRHKSGFSPHTRVDEGQAPHPGYADLRRHSGIDFSTQSSLNDGPSLHQGGPSFSQSGQHRPSLSANLESGGRFPQRHRSFDGRYQSPSNDEGFTKAPVNDENPIFNLNSENTKTYKPPPNFRSQSSETISTKFSQAGSPPRFGTDKSAAAPKGRHDSNSTATPFERPTFARAQNGAEGESTPADIPPPPKVGDKWSPEEWEQRFGVHTFEIPADSSRASSRKRSSTPRHASNSNLRRTNTMRQAGFPPTVIDADDDSTAVEADGDELGKSQSNNVSDGNAMDIDSTPPTARANGQDGEMSPLTKAQVPQPHVNGIPRSSKGDGVSQAGDSLRMNLEGFRYVAPFSTNDGLGGLGDLSSALPFESQASSAKPDFSKCRRPLELPNPPRAPDPPFELNDDTFRAYIEQMNMYLFHWNSFNSKVIMEFQRRQEEHREIGQGWVGKVGGDCEAYLHALDEDEKGREWWGTASAKHREAMQNLLTVRQKMLKSKGMA